MAIKVRILHYPDNKKLAAVCEEIKADYENTRAIDKIPPAYNCENERLLVTLVKAGKDPANDLVMFFSGLDKTRAKYTVAIFDAPEETVKSLKESAEKAGTKFIAEPKVMKFPGLFGKFTDEQKAEIKKFVADAYAKAQD